MNLNGKVILLTGASSGIGKELLLRLMKYDADIVAVARRVERIGRPGPRVFPFACDVSKKEEVDALFSFAMEKFGHIDLFIANAGFAYCEELNKPDWEHIDRIFKTNVTSPIYSLEKMKELNRGRRYWVVMTCSAVGLIPFPGFSLYSATKSAVDMFARTYRYERNDKGRLFLVYPVATTTNFFKKAGEKAGDRAPMPFPIHPPSWVAACIMAGLRMNIPFIFPSPIFFLSYFTFNRVFPFIYGFVDLFNAGRFWAWIDRKKKKGKPS